VAQWHVSSSSSFCRIIAHLPSFRDVLLVGFPKESRIDNVFAQTLLDASYTDAELKVKVSAVGSGDITVKVLDSEKKSVANSTAAVNSGGQTEFTIPVKNPLKWTAESPNLYHLVVSIGAQYVTQRIGFRQVEMKDGLIKVNGKRIVFRGVNRHEHHPKFGRAVPLEFLKQDLLTMKRHNINAIRTSHQLNDPRLYDLADEMGFWVMDEADLECHGFETIADKALTATEREMPFRQRQLLTRSKAAEWTTDNADWTKAYVDRAEHLVKRDQLHPSIIVWSLGNEAFFGRNFKAMYDHIKAYDDSRPIHYEADIFAETMDMYSRMYPDVSEIIEFGEDKSKTKPLVLCEFVSVPTQDDRPELTLRRFTQWETAQETSKSTSMHSTSIPHSKVGLRGNGRTTAWSLKTKTRMKSSWPTAATLAKRYMTLRLSWTAWSTQITLPMRA
jgi:beta-galactosidase